MSKTNLEWMSIGMQLGIYTFTKIFTETDDSIVPTEAAMKIMQEWAAKDIEKMTSMPIEDLALHVQPAVDDMLKKLAELKGGQT